MHKENCQRHGEGLNRSFNPMWHVRKLLTLRGFDRLNPADFDTLNPAEREA